MTPLTKLIAIVGPTASGKSSLAIELAARFGGEIINADSRQIYRGMEIGTATPTVSDQDVVPHHLYGFAGPDEPFSLAIYLRMAKAAIDDVSSRGEVPLLVGGTGQYVWALLEGWQVPEVPPQEALRASLLERAEQEGPLALHAELALRDSEAASRIHPNNVRRVIRALEVLEAAGPSTGRQRRSKSAFEPLILALHWERAALYKRIDDRLDDMLRDGWVEEVQALLDQGYEPDLPSMTGLGYREIAAYLRGETSREEAIEKTKWSMHRLARMQATWFRSDDGRIHWIRGDRLGLPAARLVESFLSDQPATNN